MSNYYKTLLKTSLNEQQMPVKEPEEKVWLTQAEKAPLAIELDDGSILKHVELLKGFEHIDVYVDEYDNAKYVVGALVALEELAAQAWVKKVESGAFDCGSIPWKFIIEQLGTLDSKTAEKIVKALSDADLDAAAIKQTAEALCGDSFESLAEQIIEFYGIENVGSLSLRDPDLHDVKDNDNIFAMRYDFEA